MKKTDFLALSILAVMFVLMIGSAWNDSAIMDELAHIPAGYSYITQRDYRLNPEHPPMIKDLAGLSTFLFVHPYLPTNTSYWNNDVNGQWAEGTKFLYESGNDADRIIFWARLPMILLTLGFGGLFFLWARKRFGGITALLALTFFAFSPTILTHGRFVTTDIGAAFGFFIGIATLLNFLEKPSWRNIAVAGLAFGLAQLLKFSLVLLLPLNVLLIIAWVLTRPFMHMRERLVYTSRILGKTFIIGIIALSLIWGVYALHVWRYPAERQLRDTEFLLDAYGFRPAVTMTLTLVRNPITRPLAQYILGVLMVQQRSAGGNTAFFLGEVSGAGSRLYFPLLYFLKEPLALHILSLIAIILALRNVFRRASTRLADRLHLLRLWTHDHFTEFAALVFIAFYWMISIKSPLNIGVRHVMPTFPFIYLLVSRQIGSWLQLHRINDQRTRLAWIKQIFQVYLKAIPKYLFVAALLFWLIAGTLAVFPHFMPYYNELWGGTRNGWRIAVDSNYDWGQDLKRLADFAQKNNIGKISLDYFGGGSPRYYLGERFEPWWSSHGPAHGYFAISASVRQGAFGVPAPGFIRKPEDSYEWLKPEVPIAQIGYSIFVYKLP